MTDRDVAAELAGARSEDPRDLLALDPVLPPALPDAFSRPGQGPRGRR
jgi:hypothetical protein